MCVIKKVNRSSAKTLLNIREYAIKPSEIKNSWWLNCKERPHRYTNNGCMTEIAKRPVSDGVGE